MTSLEVEDDPVQGRDSGDAGLDDSADSLATVVGKQTSTPTGDEPRVGWWYMVTDDGDPPAPRWLGCVVHVGSNYVELKGPSPTDGLQSERVHHDVFWQRCERVLDPDPIIGVEIERCQERVRALMEEVRSLTARLGVGERAGLPATGHEDVRALSLRSGDPTKRYKSALVKAKTETLPDLFEKIKKANKALGKWMKVKIIPLEAESDALQGLVAHVNDRIFSVELYAGLVEEVVCVREGEPAPNDAQVHLMQRRCYMDEECLASYETGGMDYQQIKDFDRWLSKPNNFNRIFPFPRTLVAFRVRRNAKERDVDLGNFIRVMWEKEWDKQTFIYIRNGERLYRMMTAIEFEEKLFPDTNHKLFTSQKLWCKDFHHDIGDIISDEEYQGKVEEERLHAEKLKSIPEDQHWHHRLSFHDTSDRYFPFTKDNVYYDDVAELLAAERKKHNRLVLIMQGLLDRSPVLHSHPPWQLWTNEGFAAAFKLIYDDSRAISAGDKPNFEAYRARCNAHLATGSLTVGQELVWECREAERENKRREAHHSYGSRESRDFEKYRPDGDPGPGKVATVASYDADRGACTYVWKREKRSRNGYGINGTEVEAKLVTGDENVFCVDAYRPGDFHMFFDDPRTRQEYLQWAPILLEAEECHAGNRRLRPNRALPPARQTVERGERAMDLEPAKEQKPRLTPREKWVGRTVGLRHDMETKGGTKFKAGERMEVVGYYRRELSLKALTGDLERSIRKVGLHSVVVVAEKVEGVGEGEKEE